MHSILQRQIKKALGENTELSDEFKNLIQIVDETYNSFEEDRHMMERSLELTSTEMTQKNSDLERRLNEVQEGKVHIEELENLKKDLNLKITELDEEKIKLSESKATDEAILASIGDGLIFADKDDKIILINSSAMQLLGYDDQNDNLVGNNCTKTVIDEGSPEIDIPNDNRVVTTAGGYISTIKNKESVFKRKDGTAFPSAVTISSVTKNDKIIGTIVVFRNIAIEKEIDKRKTEFISLASHQLRTPLSAINWFTEILKDSSYGELNEKQKQLVRDIDHSTKRMITLVNTLLNISRIESDRVSVNPIPTNIDALMKKIISELESSYKKKNQEIFYKIGDSFPEVNIDSFLLQNIIINLISNSIKYSDTNSKIEVYVYTIDDSFEIQIKDHGYGIPKDQQEQLFSKFFRARNISKTDTEGTGLGLYLVNSMLEVSGGSIRFESIEQQGTTFWVRYPLAGMTNKEGEVLINPN